MTEGNFTKLAKQDEKKDKSQDAQSNHSHIYIYQQDKEFRYIDHHSIRYIWDPTEENYVRLHGLDTGVKCMTFHDDLKGVSSQKRTSM